MCLMLHLNYANIVLIIEKIMFINRFGTFIVAGTTSADVHGKLYQELDDNAAVGVILYTCYFDN